MPSTKNITALVSLFHPPAGGRRPIVWATMRKELGKQGFTIYNGNGGSRRLVGPGGQGMLAFVEPKKKTLAPTSQGWWVRSLNQRFNFYESYVRPFL